MDEETRIGNDFYESMMDISKGGTLEEKPKGVGAEDEKAQGADVMRDLEPKKGEAELMAEFNNNEAKYKNFPTSPASTRR